MGTITATGEILIAGEVRKSFSEWSGNLLLASRPSKLLRAFHAHLGARATRILFEHPVSRLCSQNERRSTCSWAPGRLTAGQPSRENSEDRTIGKQPGLIGLAFRKAPNCRNITWPLNCCIEIHHMVPAVGQIVEHY